MKKIFKFYGLFAFLGMIVFGVCMGVGLASKKDYIVFIGLGIVLVDFAVLGITYSVSFFKELKQELKKNSNEIRTAEKENELLEKVNEANRHEAKLAKAAFYANSDIDTPGKLFKAALGFSKENKEAFRDASKMDKAKVVFIIIYLLTTLLIFMVGIALTELGKIGFILMGIGGGGFFLLILLFLVLSLMQRKRHNISKKMMQGITDMGHDNSIKDEFKLLKGKVERCSVHSQHIAGKHTPKISGTIYMIYVDPEVGKKFWITSSEFIEKGKKLYYYQSIKKPKHRFIKTENEI